jgi:DNA-binding response OmpR family regulator
MKILIAEDDAVSRRILEKVLINWGHAVTACEGGAEAWGHLEKGEFRLIISDWMMPEFDGLELCRRVRSQKRKEYCYFILLTARTGHQNYMEGMDAGADDYLTKPFNFDELKARLRVAERILSLQSDIQTLRTILPICAWCKKIRDDSTLWQSVEEYLTSHTDADLSHSICPECFEKQVAGLTGGQK